MKARRVRRALSRAISILLSSILLAGPVFANATPAFALQKEVSSPDAKPPTVVSEVVDKRTGWSKTYELSDGSFRREVYTGPVNYRDADGRWQPIQTALMPGATLGEHVAERAQVKASFRGPGDTRNPVRIERDGVAVELDLLGAEEGLHLATGNLAHYLAVAPDTDLLYECLNGGVKETILLASPAAPDTFTFRVSVLDGELRETEGGGWALYAEADDAEPALMLGDIAVWDAAGASAEVGAEASMTVTPDEAGAFVTYRVSRAWLNDPARAYPVSIDPTFYVNADCYVSELHPTTTYGGATSLQAGRPSGASNDDNRALFRFPVRDSGSLYLNGAYVSSAEFQVYANDVDPLAATAYLGRSNYWAPSPSWNTRPGPEPVTDSYIAHKTIADNAWSYWSVTSLAREWASPSYGSSWGLLQLYQKEDNTQAARFHKQYNSNENASYKPRLNIYYTIPSVSVSIPKSTYTADGTDVVTVTAAATAAGFGSDIRRFEVQVNGTSADPNRKRGLITWFEVDPGEGWVTEEAAGGGYFAYREADATYTTPLLEQCATSLVGDTRNFTFAFAIKDTWGDVQSNRVDYQLAMDTSQTWSTPDYLSGWKTGSGLFSVLPPALSGLHGHGEGIEWWTEPDANGDGIADSGNDVADEGRGTANLSWSPNPTATGYKIYLSDGKTFRQVATATGTGLTSWSSANLDVYPSDSAIAGLPQGYTGNPFTSPGSGLDLRDDPNPLYRKTSSAEDTRTAYEFRVVPYNSAGEASGLDAAVQMPNRTLAANDETQHTTYDLGEVARHSSQVVLDTGILETDVTDLSIASWGPEAALSRHYASDDRTSGLFAPGWRFNFEAAIETATTTYVDDDGARHRFVLQGGEFISPRGYYATLTTSSAEPYRLTFKDGDYRVFDAAGRLLRETDGYGNEVTYTRTADALTIIAENGQSIVVAFEDDSVVSATYATEDGTRTVAYDTSGMTQGGGWHSEVHYYPDTSDAHRVRYTYALGNENLYLASLDVPYLPAHESELSDIQVAFTHGGGTYEQLTLTDWSVGNLTGGMIRYGEDGQQQSLENGATIYTSGDVVTEAGWYRPGTNQEFVWHPDGSVQRKSNPYGFDDTVRNWTYEYGRGHELIREVSPMGAVTDSVYDARGNLARQCDPDGGVTTYLYDADDDLVRETDPRGSTAYRTHNAAGDVLTEERVLDAAGTRSHSEWTYDAAGRLTREEAKISEAESAVTTYGAFAASGEAEEVSRLGVKLGPDGEPVTLLETSTFDAFGNVLTRRNAADELVESNTYSVGGRLTASTDLAGATTVNTYDVLGRTVSSHREKGGKTIERTDYTVNARDQATLEEHYAGGDNPAFTIEHDIDGLGRETRTVHSIAGETVSMHDPTGNVAYEWDPDSTVEVGSFMDLNELTDQQRCQSTRHVFDADGREVRSTAPGQLETSSTVTTYTPGGRVAKVTQPDGSWVEYGYDAAGDQTSETRPTEDGATVSDTSVYDLGGRLTQSVKAAGTAEEAVTTHTYDLLGRETGSALGQPSTKSYNTMGWLLTETDADGIATTRTCDAVGRTLAESVVPIQGDPKTTIFTYEAGRVASKTDPTGRRVTFDYDDFGRIETETHSDASGKLIKRSETGYDALSRPVETTLSPAGITGSSTYPAGSTKVSVDTIRTSEASTTILLDERGRETDRIVSHGAGKLSRTVTARDGEDRPTSWSTGGSASAATYDSSGKLTSQTGLGWAGVGAAYGYDPETGRKTTESISLADTNGDYSAAYAYSDAGRLTGVGGTQSWTYGFDTAGNLMLAQQSGQTAYKFEYDAANNQLLRKKVAAALDTVYSFDEFGRRENQGSEANPSQVTYSWDGDSRLVSYCDTSRSVSATFAYDADGQRTSARFLSGSDVTEYSFVYDGIMLLSVTATETGSVSTTCTIGYIYDEADRPFAATYRGTGAPAGSLLHLTTTDRGDVVEVLNSSGTPVATYGYDAWGNPVPARTTTTAGATDAEKAFARLQPLRYASYAFDSTTGLYYLSARYYDPATCQFLSKDPVKADGEESAYQYCDGNPIENIDPSGLTVKNWNDAAQGSKNCLLWALKLVIWQLNRKNPNYDTLKSRFDLKNFSTASFEKFKENLKKYYGLTSKFGYGNDNRILWKDITYDIDINKPTILSVWIEAWGNAYADPHAVVITGYGRRNGRSVLEVFSWSHRHWVYYTDLYSTDGANWGGGWHAWKWRFFFRDTTQGKCWWWGRFRYA